MFAQGNRNKMNRSIEAMTIQARLNLQRGIPENKLFPATDYTSDGSLIDQYILARVQKRDNAGNRIILDAAAYDALVNQAAKDIEKELDKLFKDWK